MNQNNKNIALHESKHGGVFHRLVRKLTKFAWKHQVSNPVNWLYEKNLINSKALHEAHEYTTKLINGEKAY